MSLDEKMSKIIESSGAALYGTETVSEFDETIFRVFITKAGGINLDLCAEISNELSPLLDVYPPLSGQYRLEVSSPGIERKLTNPTHFKHAVGEKIKLKIADEGKVKGLLKSSTNKGIVVEVKKEEERFSFDEILGAKTYYDWNQNKKNG